MKKVFLLLTFLLSLVCGEMEIERSPTYFRDQLEVSKIAETPVVNFEQLREELLKNKEHYAKFFILKNPEDLKTSHDRKQQEIKKKLLKDKEIFEDFMNGPTGIKELEDGEEHTIVSLTSWPPRIHTVFLTIESILRQTHKPHKVVLYLAKDEFNGNTELPETLKFQQTRGLEIHWVEKSLRSYNKLLFALKEFPTSNIITVDDDNYYPNVFVNTLEKTAKENVGKIICNRFRVFQKKFGEIGFYKESFYQIKYRLDQILFLFPTGCCGILYPKLIKFDDSFFNTKLLEACCKSTDDVWFFFLGLKSSLEYHFFEERLQITPIIRDDVQLCKSNNAKIKNTDLCVNDINIHATMSHFNLYEKLNINPNSKVLKYLKSLEEAK